MNYARKLHLQKTSEIPQIFLSTSPVYLQINLSKKGNEAATHCKRHHCAHLLTKYTWAQKTKALQECPFVEQQGEPPSIQPCIKWMCCTLPLLPPPKVENGKVRVLCKNMANVLMPHSKVTALAMTEHTVQHEQYDRTSKYHLVKTWSTELSSKQSRISLYCEQLATIEL